MFQYFNIFVSCLHIFTQAFTSNYSQAGPTDVTQPLELHPCDHLPQLLDLFQGNLSVVQRSGLRNGWMLKRLKNFEGSHSTNIIRHPPIWLKTTAKHFSMRWKVWAQVKACCLHGNPWEIHGKFMGNPWEIHGKSMGNPWEIHGICWNVLTSEVLLCQPHSSRLPREVLLTTGHSFLP